MKDSLSLSFCPYWPQPFTLSFCYLLCSLCCSALSPLFSVSVCLFPQSVFIATQAKLVLCTSAGILKLHHGSAVRKIHSTSPSLPLSQNCTISSKTVVSPALVVAVNLWHVTARKLFWKLCFLSEQVQKKAGKMYGYVGAHFPECFISTSIETNPAVLYVGSKDGAAEGILLKQTTRQ